MNYKQQLAAIGGLVGTGMTMVTLWKSGIYYGKSLEAFEGLEELVSDGNALCS